jgi:NitT/TauT family transport system substrate-binding protein
MIGAGTRIDAQSQSFSGDIRVFLPFIPNVQFAPLYVMAYSNTAPDDTQTISFEYGDETVGLDLIAVGEIEMGIIGGEQVILARAGDRRVVSVYEWFQQLPIGIVIPNTTPAETIADLQGRRVGIPGLFGASYTALVAALAANDMTEADIRLEAIGFNAVDVICAGGVEASVIYLNNEPLQIRQRADAGECGEITSVTVVAFADVVDLVSNGVTVREDLIADDPDLVAAIVREFDAALRLTINNPAQAYLISARYVEGLLDDASQLIVVLEEESAAQAEFLASNPTREEISASRETLLTRLQGQFDPAELLQFQVLMETIKLWDADRPGVATAESWAETQDALIAIGVLDEPIALEDAFSNAFVPDNEASE